MEYKLNFELVPDSCWHSNLRSILTPAQWNAVRFAAYKRADGSCAICGAATNRLEAHEQWSYDENTCTQKLTGVIAICKSCHEVIHIGRTSLKGGEERASAHFMRVNGCNYAEYRKALGKANEEHRRRNAVAEWNLDLSILPALI